MKKCKICNDRIWNPWHKGFDLLDVAYKTPNHIFDYTAKDVCWACGAVTYTTLEKIQYISKDKKYKIKEIEDIMYYRLDGIPLKLFDKLMVSKELIEPILMNKLRK